MDPEKMKHYFISESTGRMETGIPIVWKFPEFDFEAPIRVGEVRPDQLVSFYWMNDDVELLVDIKLDSIGDAETIVWITEGERAADEAGIAWLKGNTEGWSNFLACLKAYLEYGINLRKGGFDFRKAEFTGK